MTTYRRHSRAIDMRGVTSLDHRRILQGALDACDYPLSRIYRNTGKRVPVSVADTSRFTATSSHADQHHLGVHPLTDPADKRAAALGLYWLPTALHPAGRIEIGLNAIGQPDLAREVFIAELAHAVDYGVPLTDTQHVQIFAVVHHGDATPHGTHGWWEERGGHDYWSDWVGEVFMALFARACAPTLPRPLEARQPWAHPVTDVMAVQARTVLKLRARR